MPNNTLANKTDAFARLLNIMDELREKCPWDKKQTLESLRSLTIEETYELADAILDNDLNGIKEEIGDLMLHLVFYAKIADEKGDWDVADALHSVCDKLIHRHPHIYGDVTVKDEEEVKANWEQLKLKEGKKSVLEGVPTSLPAMVKAFRMQEKMAKVGFDWEDVSGIEAKIQEEMQELQYALQHESKERQSEEMGDLLFVVVNYARFLGIDPETALEKVNRKVKSRFEYIEKNAPQPLNQMTLQAMDSLWDEAKKVEKKAINQ